MLGNVLGQAETMDFQKLSPTSPWTEPYQASFEASHRGAMQQSAFDRESQRPTLDALSDIYNRFSPTG